jgi:hypothetical protein
LHQCLQQSYTGITNAIGHNSTVSTTTTAFDSKDTLNTPISWHDDSAQMLRSASTESLLSQPHMTRSDKEANHTKGSHDKDHTSSLSIDNTNPSEDHPLALAERLRTAHATILNLEIEKASLIELLARAYVSMPLLESQQLQQQEQEQQIKKRHGNQWTLSPPPSPTESMTETECTSDSKMIDCCSSSASEPLEQTQAQTATIAALRLELQRRAQAAVLSEQRLRSVEVQLTQAHLQLHRQRQESLDTVRGYAQFLEDAVQAIKASQAETQRLQQALHRETTATETATSKPTSTGVNERVQTTARRQTDRASSRGRGLSQ